jgi:hypothetical protein
LVADNDTSKWAGIATALSRGMFSLDDYEYIALLDDDIITTSRALTEHSICAEAQSRRMSMSYIRIVLRILCWLDTLS